MVGFSRWQINEMMPWLYLISVGVPETINSMIGVLTVHYMVTVKQSYAYSVCTLIGAVLMLFAACFTGVHVTCYSINCRGYCC